MLVTLSVCLQSNYCLTRLLVRPHTMSNNRIEWPAGPELETLIRRYYAGEAGLWADIRATIDSELRQRRVTQGAYHIRLYRTDQGYDVVIENAEAYRVDQ